LRNTVLRRTRIAFCPKNQRSLKKKVFTGIGESYCPKIQRSLKKKKKVFTGFGASF